MSESEEITELKKAIKKWHAGMKKRVFVYPESDLVPSNKEMFKFESAGNDEISGKEMGFRSKVGGLPDMIQNSEWPICDDCKKEMSFYCQVDSMGDKHCFGDCGMVFVYVCKNCLTSKSIIENY